MKKELEYFMIDGEFGGNQDWFTNIVMNVGGSNAVILRHPESMKTIKGLISALA